MRQVLLPFQSTHDQAALLPSEKSNNQARLRPLPPEEIDFALSMLDSCRIRLCHVYDKLNSLSNSRTRLLPHQIEATHRVCNAVNPRFILADEVGLGKTVEAGLIVKELSLRRGYQRLLICTPATLTVQWQQEMRNKFNEEFEILNRQSFSRISADWHNYPRLITSIDFIKHARYAEQIFEQKWDIAVFDEAHRLRRDYSKTTHAYNFAERMSEHVEALLLLTATPFRGKLEELFYLVRLVDPHLLGPHSAFLQEYVMAQRDGALSDKAMSELRDKLSRVLLRRRKVEVGGFTKRFATTVRFDLSPEEREFYDQMTEYVRREYNLAMQQKNRANGFVMIVYQKLLDSSSRALLTALERRKIALELKIHGPSRLLSTHGANGAHDTHPANNTIPENAVQLRDRYDSFDPELIDESEDAEELIDYLETLEEEDDLASDQRTIREMRKELLTLNQLLQLGRRIRIDRKLLRLKETLQRLKREGHKQFIIFTQFRTTQDYLFEHLDNFHVVNFHGSLNMKQKEDAIDEFRNGAEVLICTEAGGEGRNLQFCNLLFNYDLPWSPLKIEQRIGRIHRFGQAKDVYIFNFATRDTVAERVLEVLSEKIKLFEQSIGESDPLLGVLEDESDFQESLMRFVSGRKSKAELLAELDAKRNLAERGYRSLNDLVAPRCLDFNLDDYFSYANKDREFDNVELERLTRRYLASAENPRFQLELQRGRNGQPLRTARSRGELLLIDSQSGDRRPATFRSQLALENEKLEFLAIGHPLVDSALDYYLSHPENRTIQAIRSRPGEVRGYYFVYLCHFENGLRRKELMTVMVPVEDHTAPFLPDKWLIEEDQANGLVVEAADTPPTEAELAAIEEASLYARPLAERHAERKATELGEKLHSDFKKEEYKVEISYSKKVRLLEERRDRQRMKYRSDPRSEVRAALTRTDHQLLETRQSMAEEIEELRRAGKVAATLTPLQVWIFR